MSFYGHTLCFLNCHLAAHMQYALERVDEFEYIMDTQTFDCKKTPKVIDHRWGAKHRTAAHSWAAACNFPLPPRLVFWFGDLNFRIQDHGIHFVRSCISSQNYNLLWSKDQVRPAQEALAPLNHRGKRAQACTIKRCVFDSWTCWRTKKSCSSSLRKGLWTFSPRTSLI